VDFSQTAMLMLVFNASMNLRLGDGRNAFQKIEVAAFVSLLDVLHE
jgi:hypothetical protein